LLDRSLRTRERGEGEGGKVSWWKRVIAVLNDFSGTTTQTASTSRDWCLHPSMCCTISARPSTAFSLNPRSKSNIFIENRRGSPWKNVKYGWISDSSNNFQVDNLSNKLL